MSNGGGPEIPKQPTAADIAEAVVGKFLSIEALTRLAASQENIQTKALKLGVGVLLGGIGAIGATAAEVLLEAEEIASPAFDRLAEVAVKDLLGVDATIRVQRGLGGREQRVGAARSMGAAIMGAMAGATGGKARGALEPSQQPAEDFLTFVTQLTLEGWMMGMIGEFCTIGQVEAIGDLDDALVTATGMSRLSRRALAPLVDVLLSTPLEWKINKEFRPRLLAAGEVARQVVRGKMTREQALEELARQGYSDTRIEALLSAARKFLSPDDVIRAVRVGAMERDEAETHLKDQGYDDRHRALLFTLERAAEIVAFQRGLVNAAIEAFADRRIDGPEFSALVRASSGDNDLVKRAIETGEQRRLLNIKHLSPPEARACVKAGILAVRDYRQALERDGYTDDAVLNLELLLRHELEEQREIEELREAAKQERLRERQARDEARQARLLEVEQERALRRRGPFGDLERAAVRGLIAIARVEEILAPEYDPDTVAILVGLVEDDRMRYLEQQARADEARKRALRRDLDVGAIEQAVMANILTVHEFRQRLAAMGFDVSDVAILGDTLEARKRDRDAALRQRAEAEERAKRRQIDLNRFELLVRRGVRTSAQYAGLLQELGFDEASRAAIGDLLALKIGDDRAADAARLEAERKLRAKGLSFEQFRRAVILGVKSEDDFVRFLVVEGFTADTQVALVAELRDAVAEAEAARQRRAAADRARREPALPLATVARAARLGVIPIDAYRARLVADGYSRDDIAIELELLVLEIADVQAARRRRDEQEQQARDRGLSLTQVEQAVKAGVQPIEAYRSRAAELGLIAEDAAVLVAVLEQELAAAAAAKVRREQIEAELQVRNLSVAQLEQAVKGAHLTVEEFTATVRSYGYGDDDAALLTASLIDELVAAAEKAAGGSAADGR